MRVLFLAKHLDRVEAATILALARYEDLTVHLVYEEGSRHIEAVRAGGVQTMAMNFHGRVDPIMLPRLRSLLREGRYDILHALRNNPLSNALLASFGLPCRIVAYRGVVGGVASWDPFCRLTYLNPRVDRIVCVADAVKNDLQRAGVSAEKLVTIHKGHDPAWYKRHPRSALRQLGILDEAFVLVCTGALRARKGVDVLIRALDRLPDDPPLHLLLVGALRDRRLQELVRDNRHRRRVTVTGHRDDAPALAGAGDVFVMPSLRNEGLPKSVIEAMLQGVPAIVSRDGGLVELVQDGVSGWIVPPGDEVALSEAIARVAADPQGTRVAGEAARERMLAEFHIETTVERTHSLYLELLHDGRPRPMQVEPAAPRRLTELAEPQPGVIS